MEALPMMVVLVVALQLAAAAARGGAAAAAMAELPQSVSIVVARALQNHGIAPGHGNTFFSASLLMPYLRPLAKPPTTLLVPTDAALMRLATTGDPRISRDSAHFRSLARLHMLTTNLTFAGLRVLPNSTFLPTQQRGRGLVRITTDARGGRVLVQGSRIVSRDLCPPSVSHLLTCHGVDRLLPFFADDVRVAAAPPTAHTYANMTAEPPAPSSNGSPSDQLLPRATVSAASAPKPLNTSGTPPATSTGTTSSGVLSLASSGLLLLGLLSLAN